MSSLTASPNQQFAVSRRRGTRRSTAATLWIVVGAFLWPSADALAVEADPARTDHSPVAGGGPDAEHDEFTPSFDPPLDGLEGGNYRRSISAHDAEDDSQSIVVHLDGTPLEDPGLIDAGDCGPACGCATCTAHGGWGWIYMPEGLIYRSYLAGVKESRMGGVVFHEKNAGWLWDASLGGRVGVLRYGNFSAARPEGWQLDIEGAGQPRLNLEDGLREFVSADFRVGIPLTYGRGPFQFKFAYTTSART